MKKMSGFSLLEIMVVLAIVAILATLAIPSQSGAIMQKRVVETLELMSPYRDNIEAYYKFTGGKLPASNKQANIPEPDKILSNYVEKMEVRDGVMHIYFGQKVPPPLHHKVLSWRMVFVKDTPDTPISWICGYDTVPEGMTAAGTNLTDLDIQYLPGRCR